MEKTYDPQQLEKHWYHIWEKSAYFLPQGKGEPYCIMLPPPNVTGTLHMGHGFQISLMDALIRQKRMSGDKVLWQVGTDHAGIATQMVVERQLLQAGLNRQELGRDAFVDRIWQWKNQSDGAIKGQLRRMGSSVDWSRERFSMDEDISKAVRKVFIDLYREKLIYRGKRLVNWDPVLLTAVSDLEVVSQEEEGFLWYLRYPILNSEEFLVVATTRPETMLGDTAVAVNPKDERYSHLIGTSIHHPLTERIIPIVADDYVDPEFGTGCVKITPGHDFNDYALGQRHQLAVINIFTPDARLNDQVPVAYQGLDRYEARTKIIAEMDAAGLLEKIVPHKLQVPRGDRSGAVIEPFLTDQWYMAMKDMAKAAMEVVKSGELNFVPENWSKTYFQWLENIQDWCISRQLWWGHRIPAWYDEAGTIYVGEDENDVRRSYQLPADLSLRQDEDVLDTWVSASLWPFATLGWPDKTPEFERFYPTNVLVTGFDILFFWVARMVMMGLKFTGKIPFKTVYVTGLIRDSEGQKMSKSKGNTLDPIDLIDGIDLESLIQKRTQSLMQPEKAQQIAATTRRDYPQGIPAFGADALRFTYYALASTGRNIRFDLGRIEGYRNFCNKLWNAARYVLMNTEQFPEQLSDQAQEFSLPDRWIRARLQQTIAEVTDAFAHFRFDLLAQAIYEFVWNEYCDWYLEFSKPLLTGEGISVSQQAATRQTLVYIFECILRLLHPLMPFITEEIWQKIAPLAGKEATTIMLQPWPKSESRLLDEAAIADIEWLKKIILSIRQIRGEMNVNPGKIIPLLLRKGQSEDKQRLTSNQNLLMRLARLESIVWLDENTSPPPAAAALVDELELFIPLAGLIDKDAELERLQKELNKLIKELEAINSRLNNPNYVEKAPAAVVDKERQRALEMREAISKLEVQQERLAEV